MEGKAKDSTAHSVKGRADDILECLNDDPVGRRLIVEAAAHARAVSPERWRVESDAASVCARYLVCHPRVARVRYPGLPSDRAYEIASRTLSFGFGPTLCYALTDASTHILTCGPCDPLDLVSALEASLSL